MKVVIQRVSSAAVTSRGMVAGAINAGLCLFVGVEQGDTIQDARKLAKKVVACRIFEDDQEKMNLSVKDIEGDILSISQFTLMADVTRGNRPSFTQAMDPVHANVLFEQFNQYLEDEGLRVARGVFRTHMEVALVNDGPVTIVMRCKDGGDSMKILNGKLVAQKRQLVIRQTVDALQQVGRPTPQLAVILVGHDPASETYVRNKERACESAGIRSKVIKLPESVDQQTLEAMVEQLNQDLDVDGILIQLPLPKQINRTEVLERIDPNKDVDGLTTMNIGRLHAHHPYLVPCTPLGIMALLEDYALSVSGLNAVVVGRSELVGRPLAELLLQNNATVTLCHTKTRDLTAHTKHADLLVAAVGVQHLILPDMVQAGAILIDVGMHRTQTGLCGDIHPEALQKASWATPVPGGVGPMTITGLLENTLKAYLTRRNEDL